MLLQPQLQPAFGETKAMGVLNLEPYSALYHANSF